MVVGALVVGLLGTWGVGRLKIKTRDGVIVLKNVPKDSVILVDGNTISFTWPGVDEPVEIRADAGQHKVEIKKDGLGAFSEIVAVKTGPPAVVKVRLVPLVVERSSKKEPNIRQARASEVPKPPAIRPVISRFARNNVEGWYTLNQDGSKDATWNLGADSRGDNAWLVAIDHRNSKEWGWHAPRKFLGDHSDKFRRVLRYDVFTTGSGSPDSDWYVRLTGGGKVLFINGKTLERPVPQQWKSYHIRLDASGGWKVFMSRGRIVKATDEDLKGVLSNVTDLRIKGEYGYGSLGCLDNVIFGAHE